MDVILNINNIKYNDIFDDLSIYIEKNTITAISGSNKCGKTTLMRILNRNIHIEANIIYKGKEIYNYGDEEYYKKIQAVFPQEIIFHENTILDELKFQQEKCDLEKIEFLMTVFFQVHISHLRHHHQQCLIRMCIHPHINHPWCKLHPHYSPHSWI